MKIAVKAASWEHDGSYKEISLAEIDDVVIALPEGATDVRLLFEASSGSDGYGGCEVRDLTVSLWYDRDETDAEREARELNEQKEAERFARDAENAAAMIAAREKKMLSDLLAKYGMPGGLQGGLT